MENKIKDFDKKNKKRYQEIYKNAEQKRKEFIQKFPSDKILQLTPEQYVVGAGSKKSFCYQLEYGLTKYGELRGPAGSSKYGVYFSKGSYYYTKKYGTDYKEAFNQVKSEIVSLLKAGKEKDYRAIQKNKIANLVKAKILAVYYPDDYLTILNPEHVTYFINCLKIECKDTATDEEKQNLILKFKINNPVMKKWNNLMLVDFLYESFNPKHEFPDEVIEAAINATDETAGYKIFQKIVKERNLNKKIIDYLKGLYDNQCQICGKDFFDKYGSSVVEAHHIEYFSKSQNNDADNIIILCPNHHRIIHKLNPKFDRKNLCFNYDNGVIEKVRLNHHLKNNDNKNE